MQNTVAAVFAHQIAITIAEETARAGAERHQGRVASFTVRHLQLANGGLMVGHAHVLGPVLGRDLDGLPGRQRRIDHALIHSLGMQIDFHFPPAAHNPVENRFPERVVPFGDAAFSMNAESDSADGRALLEQQRKRIAAVGSLVGRRQTHDRVVRIRAIDRLEAMRPDPQLELHAARNGFLADEFQHLQVPVASRRPATASRGRCIRKRKERTGTRREIRVRDLPQKVVPDAELR